jgi:hypothetical protein
MLVLKFAHYIHIQTHYTPFGCSPLKIIECPITIWIVYSSYCNNKNVLILYNRNSSVQISADTQHGKRWGQVGLGSPSHIKIYIYYILFLILFLDDKIGPAWSVFFLPFTTYLDRYIYIGIYIYYRYSRICFSKNYLPFWIFDKKHRKNQWLPAWLTWNYQAGNQKHE